MGESRTSSKTRYPGIYKVTRSGTVRYVVSYRLRGLGQKTRTLVRLADAVEFQGEMRDPAKARAVARRGEARIPMAAFFDSWLDSKHKLAPSTRRRYLDIGRMYVEPSTIGRMYVADINHEDVEAWINWLIVAKGCKPPTVDKCYRTLRACLSVASKRWGIPNPASALETPDLADRDHFALTPHQVDLIAMQVPSRDRALVYYLSYTGSRIGEASALRVEDLDLLKATVTIKASAAEVAGHKLPPGPTKTKVKRKVAISPELVIELSAHLEEFGQLDDPESLVFTGSTGRPVRQNNWRSRVFQPAAIRAGVVREGRNGKEEPPRVHDLRHTAASIAAANGYSLHEVQQMLGHSTIVTTANLYAHLYEDVAASKARALGDVMRDARGAAPVLKLAR